MKIKDLIYGIRINCGITQRELSKLTGIDASSISAYIKGKRFPSLPNLLKFLKIANEKGKMNVKYTDIEH